MPQQRIKLLHLEKTMILNRPRIAAKLQHPFRSGGGSLELATSVAGRRSNVMANSHAHIAPFIVMVSRQVKDLYGPGARKSKAQD